MSIKYGREGFEEACQLLTWDGGVQDKLTSTILYFYNKFNKSKSKINK